MRLLKVTLHHLQIILFAINLSKTMSTILQIANGDMNLSSMIKGLKAANLEETLNGIGPFTILAPINLAFGKLPDADSFENMVKPGNTGTRLSDIMTFHVVTGKKMLKD